MSAEFYTYVHTRASDNKPFYVGKGRKGRAHTFEGRNPHWHNTVAKHGLKVDIAAYWPTEAEAFEHEKFLILCFKDMAMPLVNMTDGGDGASGWVPDAEFRANVSAFHKGKVTPPETRAKMSISAKLVQARPEVIAKRTAALANPETLAKMVAPHIGKVVSEETRAKHRASTTNQMADPEARAKLSALFTGTKWTDEQRQQHSARQKTLMSTPEMKAKFSAWERTPEVRAKMREGWARRKERLAAQNRA